MNAQSSCATEKPTISPSLRRRKPSVPWETVLKPHLGEIEELRHRRPRGLSLRKIAAHLFQRHGLKVAHSTIASAIKARRKARKVKAIHSSFLYPTPPSPVQPGGYLVALRQRTVTPESPAANGDWDSRLIIDGPLVKKIRKS